MADGYRVSPPKVFAEVAHASRPPSATPGVSDTFRQTGFMLEGEVSTIVDGLTLEATLADGATGAKFRNQLVASGLALWSRAWLCRLQALHAMEWGNYMAAFPLIRSAADYQSAQLALLRTGAEEWEEWLAEQPVRLAPAQHAVEFAQHAFRSAEIMAAHEVIGPAYRSATELSLPHFGTTLLLAASESDASRIAVTFGDRDFHLGLAELSLGLIAALGAAQIDATLEFGARFGVSDPASATDAADKLRAVAARKDRCSMAADEIEGRARFVISNWRRNQGGAFQRILL
jgi:hypothetical protein